MPRRALSLSCLFGAFPTIILQFLVRSDVECAFHLTILFSQIMRSKRKTKPNPFSSSKIYFSQSFFPPLPSSRSRLDANHITTVPDNSFEGLQQLRHLWLDDNNLTEVPIGSLRHQANLQALTLALNRIAAIPDNAFSNLTSLVVL